MPSRSPKRRRSTAPPAFRRGLVVAVACAALLAGAVAWLRTDEGQLVLADRGVAAAEGWAVERFDEALHATLRTLAVPPDSVVVEPVTAGGPGVVRFGTRLDLTRVNLALTAGLEDAGATVHYGARTRDERGEQLELRIGTRPRLTHRIVARVGMVPAPPEEIPAARLAIVIDDLGRTIDALAERALALPSPVTFAVLPGLRRSRAVLTRIERTDHHAFLHLPMEAEPSTGYDAGEPQIRVGMDPAAIRAAVHGALDGMSGVVGVNNHMGSRATPSRPTMDPVMEVLAARGLVFLDSQTTPHSVAHVAAAAAGVPVLRNDIFLDAERAEAPKVAERFEALVEKALRRGWAIGIGHVNEPTVSTLERLLPTLEDRGVVLVPVLELIHDRAAAR